MLKDLDEARDTFDAQRNKIANTKNYSDLRESSQDRVSHTNEAEALTKNSRENYKNKGGSLGGTTFLSMTGKALLLNGNFLFFFLRGGNFLFLLLATNANASI